MGDQELFKRLWRFLETEVPVASIVHVKGADLIKDVATKFSAYCESQDRDRWIGVEFQRPEVVVVGSTCVAFGKAPLPYTNLEVDVEDGEFSHRWVPKGQGTEEGARGG